MLRRTTAIPALLLLGACTAGPAKDAPTSMLEDAIGTVPDLQSGSLARTTGNLNLRSGPGTSYRIKDVLSAGTELTVGRRSGIWYAVDVTTEAGWVSGRYLEAVAGDSDAGTPSPDDAGTADPDAGGGGCESWMSSSGFACSPDGTQRGTCSGGTPVVESCDRGCLRTPAGDDVCLGPEGSGSVDCPGSWGRTKATDGDYDMTAFGCWVDASGSVHTDPGDNCVPSCLAQARSSGLCDPSDNGAACEERVTWYTADAGRFGCLTRLRITNPANGKTVIGVALDFGPGCRVERSAGKAVLDASGRINRYLFGADQGWGDRAGVHVVEVDPSTPLGPVP